MDAYYFRERMGVAFAQIGRSILLNIARPHPPELTSALDALEFGLPSHDSLIIATHELVGEFISDMTSKIVVECMKNPKAKRRRERISTDFSNVRIRHGYPYDIFTLCGGLE